jgi:energy-coupling factor transporter ATP-binding protein EcfA2
MTELILNDDQTEALAAINKARQPGDRHLLTGYAGSGKTTLMQRFAQDLRKLGKEVILTAPTHKAVAVLAKKIAEAKIEGVPCRTIHSLLSLKPKVYGDRMLFERDRRAEAVTADVVVVDECSMIDAALYANIRRHLPMAFVLFVGDPAQLPPVGEVASETFSIKARSHLSTIVRQGVGNPILEAANTIRESQGGPADWSWCKSATAPPLGVYLPRSSADEWMKKAFTSPEFEADPDHHRYLCWTNQRVADVNVKIRAWRYGDNIPTPFMPGERAMFRAPVIKDKTVIFNTNEEAKVLKISTGLYRHEFDECTGVGSWKAELPTWNIQLESDAGDKVNVHMSADNRAFSQIVNRVKDEAADARVRWKHLHGFQGALAKMQSIYAMTTHTAQGSTHVNSFVDIPDIRKNTNTLEMQKMCYVAVTRPTNALILVGV